MKRIICLAISLALCLSLALPAAAAKDKFVPSITYKDKPTFIPVNPNKPEDPKDKEQPGKEDPKDKEQPGEEGPKDKDKPGKEEPKNEDKVIIGTTKKEKEEPGKPDPGKDKPGEEPDEKDKPGAKPGQEPVGPLQKEFEKISDIYDTCLVMMAVSEAIEVTENTTEQITDQSSAQVAITTSEHIAGTLKHVYKELNSGNMKLPYEKVKDCKPEDMVILELLDISWCCGQPGDDHNHKEEVKAENVVFDLTLSIGVAPDLKVVVMTYDEVTGEWEPIPEVINNGDGTITCTFAHFCPIAISIEQPSQMVETAETNIGVWMAVMLTAAAGAVVALMSLRKKQKK